MRRLLLLSLLAWPAAAATKVTLLHTSDYHSHALPFYTEEGERGGIARAIAYLRAEKRKGALVFSGGDTVNKGAPAWSDKFGCAEWPWLNEIVDAMAFGNHDADYGLEAFHRCRDAIRYPILSANTSGFRRYAVFETRGVRIGVFAVAGGDFPELVKVPGLSFGRPIDAAREVVRELRENERVDAVVMIGHQHTAADYELAWAVPGIDVIFGTHSHLRRGLTRIDGTRTWFISPWQYLGYISRVELTVENRRVTKVEGRLVPVDARMRENRAIARRVAGMQKELEADPRYRELFVPIGHSPHPLTVEALAQRTLSAMKAAANADVAISTRSSFRRPLPAGTLTLELLRGALPYDNEIVVCAMTGAQLQPLIDEETFVSGPVSADQHYRVATTDYLANKAKLACEKTGRKARAELRATLSP
jgi:5'-nucleotidase/UDP-sugar diphosphatase